MFFSYNWLQSFFKQKLPKPEKLVEILEMHLFEIEDLKKKNNDWVFDIDVLTNRLCDCGGHIGMAREIGAILKIKYNIKNITVVREKNLDTKDFLEIEVQDKDLCPRYSATIIMGVKVKDSPLWMQERLISCGLQPINNIVDATNYIMLETGQPLHAFDFDKISSDIKNKNKKKIIVRCARDGEKIITLEGKKYDLSKDILLIADSDGPLALAGIKGGKKAEITNDTVNIVLESANFKNSSIYKTSKKLDLKTDASLRFSAGFDPNMTEFAINRLVGLIQEVAGGKVAKNLIDFYPQKLFPKNIKINLDYIQSLLGVKISQKEVINILKSLDFKIKDSKSKILNIEVPTFRQDISIEEDIIEEIGRIYGYTNIIPSLPKVKINLPSQNQQFIYQKESRKFFKEFKFLEVLNYSFLKEGWETFFSKENLIEMEKPLSANTRYLRPSLIPNLVENIIYNQRYQKDLSFFEIGRIFYKKGQNLVESIYIGGATIGANIFFELKGILELFFKNFGISKFSFEPLNKNSEFFGKSFLNLKRSSEIKIKNLTIGLLGELNQKIYFDNSLKDPVYVFEINFDEFAKFIFPKIKYQPLPKYPEVSRDISIICHKDTPAGKIIKIINNAGKKLIKDIQLFDIYEKDNKKTLSFHIIYQSKKRSLSSEDVALIEKDIIKAIEKYQDFQVKRIFD